MSAFFITYFIKGIVYTTEDVFLGFIFDLNMKQNTLSPRKLAIQSSRNSQIRGFSCCSFPLNSQSKTPKLADFADKNMQHDLSTSRSNPYYFKKLF